MTGRQIGPLLLRDQRIRNLESDLVAERKARGKAEELAEAYKAERDAARNAFLLTSAPCEQALRAARGALREIAAPEVISALAANRVAREALQVIDTGLLGGER